MPFKNPEEKKEYNKKYRLENKEKTRIKNKKWRDAHPTYGREHNLANYKTYTLERKRKFPEYHRLSMIKSRAKRKGLPFNLDISDVKAPEVCPVLNIPLQSYIGTGTRGKSYIFDCPSVDRIIPELGYIKGNVQVISYRANAMKNDATPEELLMFANWVYKTYGN